MRRVNETVTPCAGSPASSGRIQNGNKCCRACCIRCEHRGPDGAGEISGPGAAFGHRRLSIIDLAGGRQPMPTRTIGLGDLNGEIYNYRELRARLIAAGHRFRTHSDTEVMLAHLYEEHGESCSRTCAACSPSPSGTASPASC